MPGSLESNKSCWFFADTLQWFENCPRYSFQDPHCHAGFFLWNCIQNSFSKSLPHGTYIVHRFVYSIMRKPLVPDVEIVEYRNVGRSDSHHHISPGSPSLLCRIEYIWKEYYLFLFKHSVVVIQRHLYSYRWTAELT